MYLATNTLIHCGYHRSDHPDFKYIQLGAIDLKELISLKVDKSRHKEHQQRCADISSYVDMMPALYSTARAGLIGMSMVGPMISHKNQRCTFTNAEYAIMWKVFCEQNDNVAFFKKFS